MSVRSISLSTPNEQTNGSSSEKAEPSVEKCFNVFLCRVCYQQIENPKQKFLKDLLCNVHGKEFEAMPQEPLSQKIKQIRKEKNVTIKTLVKKTGFSKSLIEKYTRGEASNVDKLEELLTALGEDLAVVFEKKGTEGSVATAAQLKCQVCPAEGRKYKGLPLCDRHIKQYLDNCESKDYFGKKISLLLKNSNISQTKLAKKMEYDRTEFSRFTIGALTPDITRLVQIAWCSNTPFAYFFDDAKQLSTVTSNSAHQTIDSSVNSQEEASVVSGEQSVTEGDASISQGLIPVCRVCEKVIKVLQQYQLCDQHGEIFKTMQKNRKETGNRLKGIMNEKNLDLKAVTNLTKLNIGTIKKYISGERLEIDTLETICVVGLKIPMSFLFDQPSSASPADVKIATLFCEICKVEGRKYRGITLCERHISQYQTNCKKGNYFAEKVTELHKNARKKTFFLDCGIDTSVFYEIKKGKCQPPLDKLARMAAFNKKPLAYFFDNVNDNAVQAEGSSNVQSIDKEGDLEATPSDAQTMEIVKEPKSASSSSSVSERSAFSSDPSSKVTESKVEKTRGTDAQPSMGGVSKPASRRKAKKQRLNSPDRRGGQFSHTVNRTPHNGAQKKLPEPMLQFPNPSQPPISPQLIDQTQRLGDTLMPEFDFPFYDDGLLGSKLRDSAPGEADRSSVFSDQVLMDMWGGGGELSIDFEKSEVPWYSASGEPDRSSGSSDQILMDIMADSEGLFATRLDTI